MQDWHDFFVATAGAAAALTGFIFIGISINLKQILAWPQLPNRSLEGLILPVNVLLVSCCGLIPGQTHAWLGGEIVGFWLLTGVLTLVLNRVTATLTPVPYRRLYWKNLVLTQLAILPYGLAGVGISSNSESALYGVVISILLSFIKAIYDAWILLIEINR